MAEATAPLPILENLDSRPKANDLYLWCDYVELRCLTNTDHRFSRGNLQELIAETIEIAPETEADDDLDELDIDVADGNAEAEDVVVAVGADRHEAKVADIFTNLHFRSTLFGDVYPFTLSEDLQELSLRDTEPAFRKLYLQLLLSASLRLVPKRRRKELTEKFEAFSARIFQCLMPNGWEVHRFGAKGAAARYSGNLYRRLVKLAEDLRGRLMLTEAQVGRTNVGDQGLDIVAWHPLGDDARVGIPIALAQCGCTAEEWSLKSLEASPASLHPHLHIHHPWATYYFMPQDLVEAVGNTKDWQQKKRLRTCVVLDRFRLVRLAEQYGLQAHCSDATAQISEAEALAVA